MHFRRSKNRAKRGPCEKRPFLKGGQKSPPPHCKQSIYYNYSGGPVPGPFLQPFLQELFFLHDFRRFLGEKKGHSRVSEEKMTKISDFVFFMWVIFLQKREIFAYFCLYFQIFYVFNPWGKRNSGTRGKFRLF